MTGDTTEGPLARIRIPFALNRTLASLRQRWVLAPVLALCAWMLWLQIGSLAAPILGEHRHRESDTYAVAYNFRHESWDFFHPRIDWTRGRSGIMGMEAPVLPWLGAAGMAVLGDDPAVLRTLFWLVGIAGVVCGALLLRRPRGFHVSAGFLLMLALSPMALFEMRQIQPDAPSTFLALAAAFIFWRHGQKPRVWTAALGTALFSIAVLAKGPVIVLAPAMWLFSICGAPTRPLAALRRGLLFLIPLGLLLAWFAWARHLNDAYNDGETYFAIRVSFERMRADLASAALQRHVFEFLIPCYATNWVLLPAVLFGLVLALRREHLRRSLPFLAWLAFGALFAASFAGKLEKHWYYATLLLPPLAYFGGLALGEVLESLGGRAGGVPSESRTWAVVALLVAFCFTPAVGRAWQHGSNVVSAGSGFDGTRVWTGLSGTRLLLVAVLVGVAATSVPWRMLRRVVAPLVLAATLLALPRALHDAASTLRWRTRDGEWQEFEARVAWLRDVVDRHTTRGDLIVADDENPWWLYLARRKGWVEGTEMIDMHGLGYYRKGGARLLVHVADGPPTRELRRMDPIATQGGWTVYCLDPKGCPSGKAGS